MTLRPLAILALTLAAGSSALAQPQRVCHTMDNLNRLLSLDPAIATSMATVEAHTQSALNFDSSGAVVTIPCVVHIVWNTAAENLSLAQIQSQIDVLNEDFRLTNANAATTLSQFQAIAADTEFEFALATIDPQGQPTDGVVRRQTASTSFSSNDNIKFTSSGGSNAWPASDYLNIWVGDLSGGLLGYAQFPGGPASTDGVVIDYFYFGRIGNVGFPFDEGRTATHEIGHWLNLRHIWGDGGCGVDDLVSDTPISDAPHSGCPLTDVSCGTLDNVQNYMDYSDDACMSMFSLGQKARMRALFAPGGIRESILNSNALYTGDFVYELTTTGIGDLNISVSGASPNTELYIPFSFDTSIPVGSGPLVGLGNDAILFVIYPLGTQPFHQMTDATGSYGFSVPTGIPLGLSVDSRAFTVQNGQGALSLIRRVTF